MTQLDDRATTPTDEVRGPSRRQVLLTGGVVAAAAAVTAACGSSGSSTSTPAVPASGTPAAPSPAASGPAASSPTAVSGIQVKESDVPVGGGTILVDQKIVVTQPTAGTFKAFTAVCTHQGCTVAAVTNGSIVCPCHNSMFSAADGSVQSGPAPSPLTAIPVTVSGTTISVQA